VALNDKINILNNRLSNEITTRTDSFNHMTTAIEESQHLGAANTAAIASTNLEIENLTEKTALLYGVVTKLHDNTFDINLIDLSFLNFFILILRKIINKKIK
jgi:hypothetical protein